MPVSYSAVKSALITPATLTAADVVDAITTYVNASGTHWAVKASSAGGVVLENDTTNPDVQPCNVSLRASGTDILIRIDQGENIASPGGTGSADTSPEVVAIDMSVGGFDGKFIWIEYEDAVSVFMRNATRNALPEGFQAGNIYESPAHLAAVGCDGFGILAGEIDRGTATGTGKWAGAVSSPENPGAAWRSRIKIGSGPAPWMLPDTINDGDLYGGVSTGATSFDAFPVPKPIFLNNYTDGGVTNGDLQPGTFKYYLNAPVNSIGTGVNLAPLVVLPTPTQAYMIANHTPNITDTCVPVEPGFVASAV